MVPNNSYIGRGRTIYIITKVKQNRYRKQNSSASSRVIVVSGRDLEESNERHKSWS